MNKFQHKVKDLENTRIDYKIIEDFIKDYDKSNDNIFLISEFKDNYNINQYYTRSLYEIIKKLLENNNFNDENTFLDFLENKLKETNSLSSLNRDIFIKLYLKLTKKTENVKILYDEYITNNYINVATIEDFNEYFLKKENEIQYFIKSFLYNKEWWFRLNFFDYKSWIKYESQQKILNFSKENLELFFDELNKKENILHTLQELSEDKENKFINDLIKKSLDYNLENNLYNFLITQIKFWWNFNDYYSKNSFHKINIKLFNILKNNWTLNYQQFFKDIKYWEPWYYYYNDFEEFIFQTIETSEDLKSIAKLDELEKKEYFLRNWYFYVKFSLNDLEKSKLFKESFPEQIQVFEEQRQQSIEANQKYQDENDKQILDEIKENLEIAKGTENKLFVPKFLEDFINKFDYQLRIENETVIHEIVKNQLNYFFTWENLDITKDEILSKFKKTKTWYNAPNFLFDSTFNIVFKSAQKVWFDLSKYKNKLAWYYPFQWNWKDFTELKKYFWIDEIKIIIDNYKKYPDIRWFQSYNLVWLFIENKWRNSIEFNSFLELVKKNSSIKNDLIVILKELNTDLRFSNYYLKYSLEILYNLWVEETYFKILELNKPTFNYYKDILINGWTDESFDKYKIINEFLIKSWNKEAFLWRIEQLYNWFIKIPDYEFENGQVRTIYDLEYEINNHIFIKILEEYKYIDEEIEEKIIKLIEKSFKEYDKYENYCKYIWQAVKYYLKNLSKDLEYNNKLIDKITELLSNSENINKNISFKIILWEISDSFLWKVEKESDAKKYIEKIERLEKEKKNLKKKLNEFITVNIEIYTEWKTDWKHLVRAWYELEKKWKLEKNNVNKNIIDYLIKYEDENNKVWWGDNIYNFLMTYSDLNKNKLIVWIFDTDNWEPTWKVDQKNNQNYFFKNNLWLLYLHNPHNNNNNKRKDFYETWICIECYYDKIILEKYNFILRENSSKMWADSLSKIWKNKFIYTNEIKKTLILDWNWKNKNIYDKNLNKIENINELFTKNQFAEDIAHDYLENRKNKTRYNSFYKEPNIKTWDRFLPIFISLSKIIEEWENKVKENIQNQNVTPEIPEDSKEKNNKQTFLQKIISIIKSIFTNKKI